MLLRLRRPVAALASQLSWRRLESTWVHHSPSPSAPREVPTPLILLSASRWSGEGKSEESLAAFVTHFALRGWSVSCLDLDPAELPVDDSQKVLSALESELSTQLGRLNASPFPPLMMARNLSTLIAETYVSSNALSGLVLLDPPVSAEDASKKETAPACLPTPLPPFTYEVTFPCLVAWSAEKAKELAFWEAHRIEHILEDEADAALDRRVVDLQDDGEGHGAGPNEVRMWAEDCGMLHEETGQESEGQEGSGEQDQVAAGETAVPAWYTEGNYTRNPSKSKKEPLLLDPSHISESFIRGSGPGGQAINKLSTCVQLKHSPTGIVVRCQETRSRELNRELARRKLSKELEKVVFGERESVLGKEALRERRKKMAKSRKRQRKLADGGQ